ncbi:hypothetical protein D3C81_1636840 [compost metagenome]
MTVASGSPRVKTSRFSCGRLVMASTERRMASSFCRRKARAAAISSAGGSSGLPFSVRGNSRRDFR